MLSCIYTKRGHWPLGNSLWVTWKRVDDDDWKSYDVESQENLQNAPLYGFVAAHNAPKVHILALFRLVVVICLQ